MNIYGKLVYNDQGEYELHTTNRIVNLSAILNEIYFSQESNHINIIISYRNNILFNEDGILYCRENQYGIYSLHVNGLDLESILFYNTGKIVIINITADIFGGINDENVSNMLVHRKAF